jgi:hypothetical protein
MLRTVKDLQQFVTYNRPTCMLRNREINNNKLYTSPTKECKYVSWGSHTGEDVDCVLQGWALKIDVISSSETSVAISETGHTASLSRIPLSTRNMKFQQLLRLVIKVVGCMCQCLWQLSIQRPLLQNQFIKGHFEGFHLSQNHRRLTRVIISLLQS